MTNVGRHARSRWMAHATRIGPVALGAVSGGAIAASVFVALIGPREALGVGFGLLWGLPVAVGGALVGWYASGAAKARATRIGLVAVGAVSSGAIPVFVSALIGWGMGAGLVWGLPFAGGGMLVGWCAGGAAKARAVALWSAILAVAVLATLPAAPLVAEGVVDPVLGLLVRTTGLDPLTLWTKIGGTDFPENAALELFWMGVIGWMLCVIPVVGMWFGRRIRKRSRIPNATDTDHPPVHRVGLIRHVSPHGMLRRPWTRRR